MALWTPSQLQTALWIDPSGYASSVDLADKSNDARPLSPGGTAAITFATVGSKQGLQFNGNNWIGIGGPALVNQTITAFFVLKGNTASNTQALWGGAVEGAAPNGTTLDAIIPIAQSGGASTEVFRGASGVLPSINGTQVTWANRGAAYTAITANTPQVLALTKAALTQPAERIAAAPFNFRNTGAMGEIVFAKGDISPADRQRMEGYLAHRWGTQAALPAGHPHKASPPQTEDGITGSASGTLPLTVTGQAVAINRATGSGTLALTGSSTARVPVAANSNGAINLAGSSSGTVLTNASASGDLALTGSAATVAQNTANAAGSLALTGDAAATLAVRGDGAGAIELDGSGAFEGAGVYAEASGTLEVTGASSARTRISGSVSGSIALSGAAQTKAAVAANAAGALVIVGSAATDAQPKSVGSATGTIFLTGNSSGSAAIAISSQGAMAFVGSAVARVAVSSSAAGSIILAGNSFAQSKVYAASGRRTMAAGAENRSVATSRESRIAEAPSESRIAA